MRRFLLGLLILAALPSHAWAEADTLGVISGIVVAAEGGLAIQNASVIVLGKALGVPTNRAGQFRIDRVPVGTQTLRVMIVGYRRVDRKITVAPGENVLGTIALEFQPVKIIDGDGLVRRHVGGVGARMSGANLQCVVRLVDPEPMVGDALDVEARIYNLSRSDVVLPLARDGCDGSQLPRIVVRVEGPADGFVLKPEDHTPNPRSIRDKDFVTVKSRDSFDPFLRGWKPTSLRLGRIKKPGKYRLVFQYSTYEANPDRWLGDSNPKPATMLAGRLEYVPLVQLADSVSFVVRW